MPPHAIQGYSKSNNPLMFRSAPSRKPMNSARKKRMLMLHHMLCCVVGHDKARRRQTHSRHAEKGENDSIRRQSKHVLLVLFLELAETTSWGG